MTHAQLTTRDGFPAIRLSAQIPLPAGRVWAATLTESGLATWFPFTVEYEPTVGGTIRFHNDDIEFTGEVLEYRDPEVLAFTFGERSQVRITLNSDGSDTTFALVERLAAEDEAARNAAGWHSAVSTLERLHGVDSPELSWKTIYERYIEEGFPSGAPVPGLDDTTSLV